MVVDRPHSLASALCTRETYSVARINVTSVSRLARLDSVRLTSTRLARSIRIWVTPRLFVQRRTSLVLARDFRCYWRQGDWLQKLQADFAYAATEKSKNSAVKAGRLGGFRQNKGAFFKISPYNPLIYSTL